MKDPVTWLYPAIEPYNTGRLRVSPIHEICFEESGNPSGKPVIFLHGGPGGGSNMRLVRISTRSIARPNNPHRSGAA
jgi:proline iminopeptidase